MSDTRKMLNTFSDPYMHRIKKKDRKYKFYYLKIVQFHMFIENTCYTRPVDYILF